MPYVFSDVAAAEARTAGAYVAAEVAEGGSLTPGGGSLLDQVRARGPPVRLVRAR